MEKTLHREAVNGAMQRTGFNASDLATKLGVSRQAVSNWLNGKGFPRPDKLLKLSVLLKLSFNELVVPSVATMEPQVAFRRMARQKTTDDHLDRARSMGRLLAGLVDYLPFNRLVKADEFINPRKEYAYIQEAVERLRSELKLPTSKVIDFHDLIGRFRDLQAVLVPVLWGKKDRHENALHVFLPDTATNWIFLNLDSNLIDFKFWMAHELAHTYTPLLTGTEGGEDFADAFAGAFLFPQSCAEAAYARVAAHPTEARRVNEIKSISNDSVISFLTVFYEINNYAHYAGKEALRLPDAAIHGAATNVAKAFPTVSNLLFDGQVPKPSQYIRTVERDFKTPFFDALSRYLKASGETASFIRQVMDVSLVDAKALHAELDG